jgi:hypothetical protein
VEDLAAAEVARAAQLDLLRVGSPTPSDFAVAADMLTVAHNLAPANEQILRLLIEAVGQSGDREQVTALSRKLLAMNSDDTVTLLRVVSDAIGGHQDVDKRLAAYDSYLGPKGRGLDASVRSRLALDSALLLRERGDLTGFAERLSLATELDSTNKDAAALAVTFFTQRVDDAVGRFELLENLLLADPFDSETHLALARELSSAGAWAEAQRFYGLYSTLLAHHGQRVHEQIAAESITARWNESGAASVLRELRDNIETQRDHVRQVRKQVEEAGQPMDGLERPEDVRLAASVERVRLIAAAALGDAGQLEYARQEYLDGLRRQEAFLSDPAQWPEGFTDEQAQTGLMLIRAEAAWTFLWAGFNVEEAEQIIAGHVEQVENPEAQARYRGMLLLRQGDIAGGRVLLEEVRDVQPLALVGLAIAEELEGRPQEAAAICADLTRFMGGSLAGAWARTRHEVLTGQPAPLPLDAEPMRQLGQAVPGWLDGMVQRPMRAVHLRTRLQPDTVDVLERSRLTITVKNTSRIPLAVGPEKVINSRLLLSPQIQVGVAKTPPSDLSTVLSADRRLRLMPGTEYSIEVDPALGLLGAVMHELSGRSMRVRWRVLQGFTLNENGAYTRSALGQATQTPMLYRHPSRWADFGAQQLEQWIRTGSARDIAEALSLLRWRLGEGGAKALPEDEMLALGRAVAERYPQLARSERLLLIALLPMGVQEAWLAPVDEALAAEEDPEVQLVAVVVRSGAADSPLAAAASASGDERVRSAVKRLLGRGHKSTAEAAQPGP